DPQERPGDGVGGHEGARGALLGAPARRGADHGSPPPGLAVPLAPPLDAVGLGADRSVEDQVVQVVEHGHLVPARVVRAPDGELLAVPVAVEIELVLEGGHLEEPVRIVALPVDAVVRRPVAGGDRRDLVHRQLELVAPEHRRVPGDAHDSRHQAPTSAWIAPGPSAVRPRPSASAPTRMAILPRCSFLYIDWCASATPSNVIVFHSAGWILPDSISSLALVAS